MKSLYGSMQISLVSIHALCKAEGFGGDILTSKLTHGVCSFQGCPVILPREKETVLLGAAVLGAVASRQFESVHSAMKVLNAPGLVSMNSPTSSHCVDYLNTFSLFGTPHKARFSCKIFPNWLSRHFF